MPVRKAERPYLRGGSALRTTPAKTGLSGEEDIA
jgi:hypothetical protein